MAAAQDSSDWLGLSGRVTVVTGGGGGIGRATAVSFARAGARVAIIDRDEKGLETTRSELRTLGADPVVAPCDTTNPENVAAAAATVRRTDRCRMVIAELPSTAMWIGRTGGAHHCNVAPLQRCTKLGRHPCPVNDRHRGRMWTSEE